VLDYSFILCIVLFYNEINNINDRFRDISLDWGWIRRGVERQTRQKLSSTDYSTSTWSIMWIYFWFKII